MKRIVVTLAAMLIFAAAALGQAAMMDTNESAGIVVNFADLDDVRELAEAGPTVKSSPSGTAAESKESWNTSSVKE